MYTEVSVVVDGALEEEQTFHDYLLLNEYVATIEDDAKSHGYLTQVYIIEHEHADLEGDEECVCVQYLTDHHPSYSWNTAEE